MVPLAVARPPNARRRGRVAFAGGGLAAVALLAGCSPSPPDGRSYFPLDAGRRWVYDVTTERDGSNAPEHEALELRALGEDRLDDGPAWRRQSSDGMTYWLRADASGVRRVASRSEVDEVARRDVPERPVLKAPFAVGTQWQAATTAYLLRRSTEFPPEIRHTHPSLPMVYTIEATGERVATRAGTFDDCLRVRGAATVRLYADPVTGWRDVPLTTLEWHCRGVGLVKLERSEPARSTFLSGGTLTMELVARD